MASCRSTGATVCFLLAVYSIAPSSSTMVKLKLASIYRVKRDATQPAEVNPCDPAGYEPLDSTEKWAVSLPHIDATLRKNLTSKDMGKSEAVSKAMTHLLQMPVKGLQADHENSTDVIVKDVIALYRNSSSRKPSATELTQCLSFPFGGSVRDMFLGENPNDVDLEITCAHDVIKKICIEAWGEDRCHSSTRKGSKYIWIGEKSDPKNLDAISWEYKFFGGSKYLEYTANSLAYYYWDSVENGVIIDLTGQGKDDACNKSIEIPGPSWDWDAWKIADVYKVFRFWKLRVNRKFSASNATTTYIVNSVKSLLATDNGKKTFSHFQCVEGYGGVYDDLNNKCRANYTNCTIENQAFEKGQRYLQAYEEDMNSVDETVWPEAKQVLEQSRPRRPDIIGRCVGSAARRGAHMEVAAILFSLCLSAILLGF